MTDPEALSTEERGQVRGPECPLPFVEREGIRREPVERCGKRRLCSGGRSHFALGRDLPGAQGGGRAIEAGIVVG